jgi:hypothetical protein
VCRTIALHSSGTTCLCLVIVERPTHDTALFRQPLLVYGRRRKNQKEDNKTIKLIWNIIYGLIPVYGMDSWVVGALMLVSRRPSVLRGLSCSLYHCHGLPLGRV